MQVNAPPIPIDLALDGPINGTVANKFPELYLAESDRAANHWANAAVLSSPGGVAQAGALESLSTFLTEKAGTPLANLKGCWGVDPATGPKGLGHAWAIVAGGGSGIFAVDLAGNPLALAGATLVPEPSAAVLLIAAAGSLGAWFGRRRRKRNAER